MSRSVQGTYVGDMHWRADVDTAIWQHIGVLAIDDRRNQSLEAVGADLYFETVGFTGITRPKVARTEEVPRIKFQINGGPEASKL